MRPWLRNTLAALALSLLALGALLGGAWLWSGSDSSLNSALRLAANNLPAGQTLEAREVSGSLRAGGHIGWLRWQQGDLSVQAQDVTLAWAPAALLQRELRLSQVHIKRLIIRDQRAPSPAAISTPPTDLGLPFRVDADVRVDALEWAGATSQQLEQLSFHYVFDSYLHKLDKGQSLFSSNIYKFSGQLQASAEMALELQVTGGINAPVPASKEPLRLDAQAQLRGALAGPQAELMLQADIKPPPTDGSQSAMQASLSARIAPWQAQKITGAQAQWQALNLASIWPQAPETGLTGQASVSPQGDNWQASIALDNTLSGPWNEQRLPVQQVKAELTYASGHWLLQSLQALAAGGSIQAQDELGAEPGAEAPTTGTTTTVTTGTPTAEAPPLWRSTAQVKGINPAAIDSRLAPDAISGSVSVRQTSASPTPADNSPLTADSGNTASATSPISASEADQFSFDLDLKSSSASKGKAARVVTAPLAGLHLQNLKAQGHWSAPQLDINALQLTTEQAQLQGQLKINTANFATQGKLSLALPGLQADANGLLAPADGLGTLSVQVQDAAKASRWLSLWPKVKAQLAGAQIQGSAELSASWQGGWQQGAQALTLNASLSAPQLEWLPATPVAAAPAKTIKLEDARLEVSGQLSKLQLSSKGQVTLGVQKAQWQTQATAGRVKDGSWQASLTQAELSLRSPNAPTPWQLRLGGPGMPPGAATSTSASAQPLSLRWQPGTNANTLSVSAGSAQLQGPSSSAADISWQPIRWSQSTASGQATTQRPAQWRSQGRIDRVPLTWLDAFLEQPLSGLGISSDAMLSGNWDAAYSDTLHLVATLERSAGDVRIQAEAGRSTALAAGLQEARLQVNLDGEQLTGTLRWDSQRAGKALVAFGTQLTTHSGGLTWPANAPVGASLQLELPPVDAWSALAPPGWRLRGKVDTHIDVAGTRAKPQWEGNVRARDLAVRSVVDGIDFSQGTLDARLHDQQIDIQTFTLRGAGTPQDPAAGGQLSMTGSVFWLPEAGQSSIDQRFQMALKVQLSALRLSARPDRRLVASGQLEAELKDARLTLRGSLIADQALITLPDDSTPSLDDDVRVRKVTTGVTGATKASPQANQAPASQGTRITPDVSVNLDLGPDFQLRGRGLQARLAGKLVLTAEGNAAPELVGSIRAVNGTYEAYGQRLQIQRGLIRFYGPIDNPALAILAIRPKLTQRVGVQLSGTALSPVVSLYSDPGLSDVETLTWLVLGRSSSAGGAEAALMQQAALALLSGNGKSLSDDLTKAFGLDELSFSAGEGGDATNTTSYASITLGKRLSKDFYVAYESSLGGAMGVFYIFYDLSRFLTLRAQTGEQSAVDLIWTKRYD
ncbi:translocation/assembly module TamB domain-containing protein [Rhodoferax antarcticus]|uniref:translocation/assembly module TamB domain-containing protein n=1 Tax=Rhodoferax antarcticus TaxID=81479 RepID=UPI0022254BC3|nr:translocation/assembly module TamB domain-containing protein [Rhodoferax antarcticus]MCW2311981.1 translocation and assembly module TamB [Rhodoferax antarcticus]